MKNIIKSQLFQLKKDKISIFTFIAIAVVELLLVYMMYGTNKTYDGVIIGGEEVARTLSMFALLPQFFMYIFTAQSIGADFKDKTCNYEIMSGHTRLQVFFGRAIPTIIISVLGTISLMAIPCIAITAIYGWGNTVSHVDYIIRLLLMIFPVIRITCEFILFSFIIRNPYVIMGLSYVGFMALGINESILHNYTPVLGFTTINNISTIDFWYTYGLDTDIRYIYETAMPAGDIVSIIVVSLLFAAAALYLGYVFFKNDDMH